MADLNNDGKLNHAEYVAAIIKDDAVITAPDEHDPALMAKLDAVAVSAGELVDFGDQPSLGACPTVFACPLVRADGRGVAEATSGA